MAAKTLGKSERKAFLILGMTKSLGDELYRRFSDTVNEMAKLS